MEKCDEIVTDKLEIAENTDNWDPSTTTQTLWTALSVLWTSSLHLEKSVMNLRIARVVRIRFFFHVWEAIPKWKTNKESNKIKDHIVGFIHNWENWSKIHQKSHYNCSRISKTPSYCINVVVLFCSSLLSQRLVCWSNVQFCTLKTMLLTIWENLSSHSFQKLNNLWFNTCG